MPSLYPIPVSNDSVFTTTPGKINSNLLVGSHDKAVSLDPKMHSLINRMALDRKLSEVMIVGDFYHPPISWQPYPHILHDHAPGHPDLQFV